MRDERNRKIWIWVYVGHKKIISNRERYKSQHSLNSKTKTKKNKKLQYCLRLHFSLTQSTGSFCCWCSRIITGPASRYTGTQSTWHISGFQFHRFFFTQDWWVFGPKGFQDKLVLKNPSSNRIQNIANTETDFHSAKGASGAVLEWNVSLSLVWGVRLYEGTCLACHMCHRKKSISQHFII